MILFVQFFNHFLTAPASIQIFTVGKILLLSTDHHADKLSILVLIIVS